MTVLLALDTATEAVAVGIASLDSTGIGCLHSESDLAPRKANEVLLHRTMAALARTGRTPSEVGVVVVGRGPGSFTGVRIGVATAKGLAHGLGAPLYGVGTLDAMAWQHVGFQGTIAVVGDAMRGEVYPALFASDGTRVSRLTADRVAAPAEVAHAWAAIEGPVLLVGNGLAKYREVFSAILPDARIADEAGWYPSGEGLLAAFEAARSCGELVGGDPGTVLPVYTRLSDAEEAERARLGLGRVAPPDSGVAGVSAAGSGSVTIRPMRREDLGQVVAIETTTFADPWTETMFGDELGRPNRAWVVAIEDDRVVGYAGLAAFADEAHLMNLAVREDRRGAAIGRQLLQRIEELALAFGTTQLTLECRRSNVEAIGLYESRGLRVAGARPGYYAEAGEDALIMTGRLRDDATRAEPGDDGLERPLILAIESSCDETAAAVISGERNVAANVVASQVDFHARFGGVVPEIASRKHTEAIVGVVEEVMERAGEHLSLGGPLVFRDLDAIAVTYGPGLVGALVVGLAYAKGLSAATGLPLVGVNHLEGHIFANVLADPEVRPPFVALVVSGGHTSLVHVPQWGEYHTLGETLDDAAGEAFDKVAKVLGLGYPGGPVLSRMAAEGDPTAIDFPRAMLNSGDYRFSLSGLKTAVINHIRHEREAGREIDVPDLAASFQAAVVDVQVTKAVRAVQETGAVAFCLAGGVAANPSLREELRAAIEPLGVHVSVPPMSLCTDNAAMIAAAAHYRFRRGDLLDPDADAVPGLRLDTPPVAS